jgi:hypothetical protein
MDDRFEGHEGADLKVKHEQDARTVHLVAASRIANALQDGLPRRPRHELGFAGEFDDRLGTAGGPSEAADVMRANELSKRTAAPSSVPIRVLARQSPFSAFSGWAPQTLQPAISSTAA